MSGGGKGNIIRALEELDKKDIYSLILFVLYRLKEIPEYSTLSELVYILDNENFIRLLNYYGGKTIRIPKVEELSTVLDALIVYERQQNTDMPLSDIFKELDIDKTQKPDILKLLNLIPQLLENYDFKRDTEPDKR